MSCERTRPLIVVTNEDLPDDDNLNMHLEVVANRELSMYSLSHFGLMIFIYFLSY